MKDWGLARWFVFIAVVGFVLAVAVWAAFFWVLGHERFVWLLWWRR